MDCPQCGGALDTYALSGQEASVCEDCGFVGIPAEHRGEPRRVESWDDALRRFYRAHDSDGEPGVELQPPLTRPGDGTTETWDDALRRFRERRTDGTDETPERERDAPTDEESEPDESEAAAESETDGTDEAVESDAAESDEAATPRVEANAEAETDAQSASRAQSESETQSSAGDS